MHLLGDNTLAVLGQDAWCDAGEQLSGERYLSDFGQLGEFILRGLDRQWARVTLEGLKRCAATTAVFGGRCLKAADLEQRIEALACLRRELGGNAGVELGVVGRNR